MKSQKGVTLISLTVYIIALTLVITIVAVISGVFYKNVKNVNQTINPNTEYSKFNASFTEEINNKDIRILEYSDDYIVFNDNVQYMYVEGNKGIYRNKVKICKEIESCKFENIIENGKNIIKVTIKAQNGKQKEMKYTLNN